MSATTRLSRGALFCYGLLALPLAFAGLPLYLYLPDFYIRQMGVPMGLMGALLLVLRGFDAIQDPIIGYVSDRSASRRAALILAATLMLGLGFVMLYHPPTGAETVPWFAASLMLATFAFSAMTINLNAFGSLWSGESEEKTRITATRESIGIAGLFIAILTPTLLQFFMPTTQAFRLYADLFFGLTVICGAAFYIWQARQAPRTAPSARRASLAAQLGKILASPLRVLFAGYGLSVLSSSIPGVLVVYFVRDRLQAASLTGLFLGLYFLTAIMGVPLWQYLARRVGKARAWGGAMLLAAFSVVWAAFLGAGDVWGYGAICLASGVALGGELILPPSLASDIIDRRGLQGETSLVFSLLHFLSKLALALASGLTLIILGDQGYSGGAAQTPQALFALSMLYAVVPCVIKMIAAIVVLVSLPRLSQKMVAA